LIRNGIKIFIQHQKPSPKQVVRLKIKFKKTDASSGALPHMAAPVSAKFFTTG
jgi:hypothetical protein